MKVLPISNKFLYFSNCLFEGRGPIVELVIADHNCELYLRRQLADPYPQQGVYDRLEEVLIVKLARQIHIDIVLTFSHGEDGIGSL